MVKMSSRERFRTVLNHREPDRVPIDVGQDLHNGLHEVAYRNLLEYLEEDDEIRLLCPIQHLAVCKESVLNRLHSDTKYIFAGPGSNYEFKKNEDGSWQDEWGVKRKSCGLYDESFDWPLKNCTLNKAKRYKMPNPCDPQRFKGLKERAAEMYNNTEYALIAGSPASFFYITAELIGFQEYMELLALEPSVIEALVDKLLEWNMDFFDRYLDSIGEYIEMIWIGDDWGTQMGPIMSPKIFRDIFMKRYRVFTKFIKKKANVKIALHSCGSVLWALEDLIEAGIEVIHPLQPTAADMGDSKRIKEMFGDRLVFYSNLSNQTIIPRGTPKQVEQEVREKIKYLAPGGGYIVSAGHNIQADVPPENIVSLFDSAYKYGKYPIDL